MHPIKHVPYKRLGIKMKKDIHFCESGNKPKIIIKLPNRSSYSNLVFLHYHKEEGKKTKVPYLLIPSHHKNLFIYNAIMDKY